MVPTFSLPPFSLFIHVSCQFQHTSHLLPVLFALVCGRSENQLATKRGFKERGAMACKMISRLITAILLHHAEYSKKIKVEQSGNAIVTYITEFCLYLWMYTA